MSVTLKAVTRSALLLAIAADCAHGQSPPAPSVTPWAAHSFRLTWAPPGYPVVPNAFTPFADAPASASVAGSSTQPGVGATYTNGNLRVDVADSGLFTATRISDGFIVAQQTALTFGTPLVAGLPPTAQLELAGHAVGETLFGMGELGLTGRVSLESPFERNFAG